ncbi:MAG: hypothetical protein ACP5O7_10840, partial [Phycisphaerae bacterium]
ALRIALRLGIANVIPCRSAKKYGHTPDVLIHNGILDTAGALKENVLSAVAAGIAAAASGV